MTNCKSISCKHGEFLSLEGCKQCNFFVSVLTILVGAAAVIIAGLYVEQVAQERTKMIQIKILR